MSQFLVRCEDLDESAALAVVRGEEAHHLSRVVRARKGERVRLFDGAGNRWDGVVENHGRDFSTITGVSPLPSNEPPHPLMLAAALIKADRWEWLLEKAVELGVTAIIPLAAERSQLGAAEARKKAARWRKLILAAAKQCERGLLPALGEPVTTGEFACALPSPASGESRWNLSERTDAVFPEPRGGSTTVAIGPEGGFTEGENEVLLHAGFTPATLGPRILRSETAALTALALVGRGEKIER